MSDSSIGKDVVTPRYHRHGFAELFNRLFSRFDSLPTRRGPRGPAVRWTPSGVALAIVGMIFDRGTCMTGRFADIVPVIQENCRAGALVGTSFNGLFKALSRHSDDLLREAKAALRERVRGIHRNRRTRGNRPVLAVDGSKLILPATQSNEDHFGIADNGTVPQAMLTAVVDLDSGIPWDWRIDRARADERNLLNRMIPDLPSGAILLADRLYFGHRLWLALHRRGIRFVIRVGANVHLIRDLMPDETLDCDERSGVVYSWPSAQRRNTPPLRLRLIKVKASRGWLYLLTNVLDCRELTVEDAAALYRRRWGVETQFRTIKQHMGCERLLSRAGERAEIEAEWSLVAMGTLAVLGSQSMGQARKPASQFSPAAGLRVLRRAVLGIRCPTAGELLEMLIPAQRDSYCRRSSKASRYRRRTRNTPAVDSGKPPRVTRATRKLREAAARSRREWDQLE
jgi:IS4 transposase